MAPHRIPVVLALILWMAPALPGGVGIGLAGNPKASYLESATPTATGRHAMNAIQTDQAPAAIGPYSQAVSHNGLLFISGQLGIDPATGELPDGTEAQTRQALNNLLAILQAASLGPSNVLKVTIYVENMVDFALVNRLYAEVFQPPYPAREVIQAARLPKDGLVEISAIAAE